MESKTKPPRGKGSPRPAPRKLNPATPQFGASKAARILQDITAGDLKIHRKVSRWWNQSTTWSASLKDIQDLRARDWFASLLFKERSRHIGTLDLPLKVITFGRNALYAHLFSKHKRVQ